ncbi:MAG: 1,4-dihydroxy-2-naphthoate octaprenyltransferase [Microbacteriaceae bacterium BACL25 MAG-120322-bin65]|nr:MAG: 1,4-dihydroxy-2-naphthoate octaprenyltransferase [Microbacteriaceae bacterium BACL25 MAG-120322-bin65]
MAGVSQVSPSDWIQGARLRTLPLAIAPVVLGVSSAILAGAWNLGLAFLALVVALALQIGVNFANDYSDGIRGTDDVRVGPARLTGSGRVKPELVKRAAWIAFALAGVAGVIVVVLTAQWELLLIGAAAIAAAWFYTGGASPYGYRGLGEIVVFVFFGPVATVGTAWLLIGSIPVESWLTGSAAGFFASAVLLVNNIRDIDQDRLAHKRTLAVWLGPVASKVLLIVLLMLPYVIVGVLSFVFVWAPLVFLTGIITIVVIVIVLLSKTPKDLITALGVMSLNALVFALALGAALVW